MDKSRYPADWDAISAAVRERAGNCCEWCGVPNGAVGARDRRGYFHTLPPELRREGGPGTTFMASDGPAKVIRVVLTVAHLGAPKPGEPPWHGDPHDKSDVRDVNLAALCNRCHLGYDLMDHVRHAAETRRRKRIAAGQMEAAL